MSEELVITYCAPTLAGIKSGNLFSLPCDNWTEINAEVRKLNRRLCTKGIRIVPIKGQGERMLVYIYRPQKLRLDFQCSKAQEILKDFDYPYHDVERCVAVLAEKIKNEREFPHEIGLFLGYPPEDVRGFIENKAQNFKYVGAWKVYGDKNRAIRRFEQFKTCTEIYYKDWRCGMPLEKLVVAL